MKKIIALLIALSLAGCLYAPANKTTVFDVKTCHPCFDIETFWQKNLADLGLFIDKPQTTQWVQLHIQVTDENKIKQYGLKISLLDGETSQPIEIRFIDTNGYANFQIPSSQPLPMYALIEPDIRYTRIRKSIDNTEMHIQLQPSNYSPKNVVNGTNFQGAINKETWIKISNQYTLHFSQPNTKENQTVHLLRIFDQENTYVFSWIIQPNHYYLAPDFIIHAFNETVSNNGRLQLEINITQTPNQQAQNTECALYDQKNDETYTLREKSKQRIQTGTECFNHYKSILLDQAGCGAFPTKTTVITYADDLPKTIQGLNDLKNLNFAWYFHCPSNAKTNP